MTCPSKGQVATAKEHSHEDRHPQRNRRRPREHPQRHFGHAAYMTVVEFDDDMNIVSVESGEERRSRCRGLRRRDRLRLRHRRRRHSHRGHGHAGRSLASPTPASRFTPTPPSPTSVTWPACSRRARSRSWIPPTPAATREGLGPQRPRGTCPIARPARRAADSSGFCFGLNAPGR